MAAPLSACSRRRIVSWPLVVEPYWQTLPGSRPLLDAIAEQPLDDTLRLILADWLDDHGETARAEFIRHTLEDLLPFGQLGRCEDRAACLLESNSHRWLRGLPEIDGVRWHRVSNFTGGLLERLVLSWNMLNQIGRVFEVVDLRSLKVLGWLPGLAEQPWLERLCSLEFELLESRVGDGGAASLGASPYVKNLFHLDLRHAGIGPAGARRLASPHLANLCSLNLRRNQLGPEGTEALASSPHLAGLVHLDMSVNRILAQGAAFLGCSPHLCSLSCLSLADNQLGPEGVEWLVSAAHAASLSTLGLSCNGLGDEGAALLAAAPHLANLSSLGLGYNRIGAAGATALAGSPHLTGLVSLDLRGNNIDPASASLLRARWPFVVL